MGHAGGNGEGRVGDTPPQPNTRIWEHTHYTSTTGYWSDTKYRRITKRELLLRRFKSLCWHWLNQCKKVVGIIRDPRVSKEAQLTGVGDIK